MEVWRGGSEAGSGGCTGRGSGSGSVCVVLVFGDGLQMRVGGLVSGGRRGGQENVAVKASRGKEGVRGLPRHDGRRRVSATIMASGGMRRGVSGVGSASICLQCSIENNFVWILYRDFVVKKKKAESWERRGRSVRVLQGLVAKSERRRGRRWSRAGQAGSQSAQCNLSTERRGGNEGEGGDGLLYVVLQGSAVLLLVLERELASLQAGEPG